MFCNSCGTPLPADAQHCPHCGRPVPAVPAAAVPAPEYASSAGKPGGAAGRVARHRNILGVLWLVRALILLPGGLLVLSLSHLHRWPVAPGGAWQTWPNFMSPLLRGIGLGLVVMGVLAIVTGVGLLQPQSWARILAIVLGIIDLVSIPLGTALGIYTLWVLMPHESDLEFNQLVRARAAPRPFAG